MVRHVYNKPAHGHSESCLIDLIDTELSQLQRPRS